MRRPLESPFLDDELFTRESAPDWEPRASALVAESPFLDALGPASLDANLQDDVGEALDEEPYEYREPIEQESDEGYGFRHELDDQGGDEQATDKGDEETEDEFGSFEGFAPKVSAATLRTRIDDYFDLVDTEYTLTDGTKVKARSQFRYAKSGGIGQAKTRLAKTLGSSFEKKHPRAIHYAVYGRPKPAQIAAITQALIDAGQFDALRKKYPTLTHRQLIRRMQREFGIGIDCAGYVQLAFIYAFTGSDDDPKKTRLNLGLQERRGNERLSDLPSSHFKKLASVTDAETGDLLVLRPRDGDIDRAWHTVMIVERTSSGTEHTFLGDASWGTDLYGENAGGIGRRQLVHDTATGEWWDIHPLTGAEAHRNTVGPYAEHHLHGVFRARQRTKTAKPTPELETWLDEAETTEQEAEQETDKDATPTEHEGDQADTQVEDSEEEGVGNEEEVDLTEQEEAREEADEVEEAVDERPAEIVSHVYEDFEGIEELEDSVEAQPDRRGTFEGDTEQPVEWGEKEAREESAPGHGEAEEEEAGAQQRSHGGRSPPAASVNVLLDEPVEADDKFQLVSKDGKYAKTLGAADAQKLVEGAMRLTFTGVDPKKEYRLVHIRSTRSRQLASELAKEWREREVHPPAPHPAPRSGKPLHRDTAAYVMWQIIRFLRRQDPTDPDEYRNPPNWYREYAPLLREWFLIAYGEKQHTTRKLPQGLALRDKVDAAFAKTRPILDVLRTSGGKQWVEIHKLFYPKVADLDYQAAVTGPKTRRLAAPVYVDFPLHPPKAVSLAEFLSATTQSSKTIRISRGEGTLQLGGDYKPGAVWTLGGMLGRRVLLWTNGWVVFFSRDGQIYAQDGRGFSEDVIFGSLAKAGEDAAGAVLLAQLMVDIGLSFTPWGVLWDGVSALRDITAGDWKGVAQSLLPGTALKLATSARAVRKTGRPTPIVSTVSHQVVNVKGKGSVFVGRGGYQRQVPGGGLEWRRGKWMVEQPAGGPKRFQFFDDVDQRWHKVDEVGAAKYITCSRCIYSALGKRGALIGHVDEMLTKIARDRIYSANGRPLIARKRIEEVIEAYGPAEGEDIVDNILDAWRTSPNAVTYAEDTLIVAKDLSGIKGAQWRDIVTGKTYEYQDAADIFADLLTSSSTAKGTLYELQWAAKHVDEIEAMGVPMYREGWKGIGKGLDILKKNGAAFELKNYDFTREIYSMDPGRAAAGIRRQAESRLKWKDPQVTGVTFVFASNAGPMPAAFKKELDAVIKELAQQKEYRGRPVRIEFWPR